VSETRTLDRALKGGGLLALIVILIAFPKVFTTPPSRTTACSR